MRTCKLQPPWYLRSGGVENWAFFFAWNLCIKSNHRCRNRSWYDEKLSKSKTAKRFATHFSISLHSASTGITVLRIDLQDAWTRASHYGLFRETFLLSFSFLFFLKISLFIFRHLHAEEISTANRPCGTFSPLLESTATSNFPQKQRPPVERFDWMQWCDYSICLFVHSVFVLCLFYIAFFEDLRNFCSMLIISLLLKWSTFWWARK